MSDWVSSRRPGFILSFLTVEFLALITIAIAYDLGWWDLHRFPAVLGGVLPLLVPWGGALGGVCNAMIGVSRHWADFDPDRRSYQARRWNAWYLVQLPIGAAFGTVATLIVVLFLGAIGTTTTGEVDITPRGVAVLFVIAFVVGYRQDVFRKLVERVVDVILVPGTSTDTSDDEGFSLTPTRLDFGKVTVGSVGHNKVAVKNLGRGLIRLPDAAFEVPKGAFTVAGTVGNVAGGATSAVPISFSPTAAEAYKATLTVTVDGKARTVSLTGTGVAQAG
jgi:hypothetical protein